MTACQGVGYLRISAVRISLDVEGDVPDGPKKKHIYFTCTASGDVAMHRGSIPTVGGGGRACLEETEGCGLQNGPLKPTWQRKIPG